MNEEQAIERAVLSSYIFDSKIAVESKLKADDFYFLEHQAVFQIIQELIKENLPIDENFILKRTGDDKKNIILEIISSNPISNVKAYENELIQKSKKRKLEIQLKILLAKSSELTDIEILSEMEKITSNKDILTSSLSFKQINNIKEEKPTFYLNKEFPIQKNEINLYSAKGGTGKSWMLLYALARLEEIHGLKCVGWFSEETAGGTKYRINKLSEIYPKFKKCKFNIYNGDEMAQSFVKYGSNKNIEVSNFFYQFKKACKDFDVICLDPLIAFYGADENNNGEARFFMNLLNNWCKKEDKTLLIIHHHNKGEDSSVRGASAFIDAVRMHSVITKAEKNNEHIRKLVIEKTNHYSGNLEHDVQLFKKHRASDTNKKSKKELPEPTLLDLGIEIEERIDPKKIKGFDKLEQGGHFG